MGAFRFVAAPPDLTRYCNSLYVWTTDEQSLADVLPAYSGQMASFVQGKATMQFDDGKVGRSSDAFFLAPLCQAREFQVRGPAKLFGVSLNFRGWAALTGLSVKAHHDTFLSSERALGFRLGQEFSALADQFRSGALDEEGMLDAMAGLVRRGLSPLPERHSTLIDRTLGWLSGSLKPDLDELYQSLPYSKRQVQRLVSRFFGQSPVRLVRRYRAVRAASLLSLPELPPEVETDIRNAFYDQAHMVKELRFFTGRTPSRLQNWNASPVGASLRPDGYSSVDLFAAGEGRQLGEEID